MNKEILKKVKEIKSVEELKNFSKSNGKTLTDEEAKHYFETIHSNGKLSMQELDNVAGGCGDDGDDENDIIVSKDFTCSHFSYSDYAVKLRIPTADYFMYKQHGEYTHKKCEWCEHCEKSGSTYHCHYTPVLVTK